MKVILIILLIIAVLAVLLWFGLKKIWNNIMTAQMAPDNYTSEVKTGGELEAKYMAMGSYEVKCFTFDYADDEEIKTIRIWYPAELETSDRKYPAALFVNGTGVGASRYKPVFEHLASWGFIAIGNEDPSTWEGKKADLTLSYLLNANEDGNSIFYHRLDMNNIGVEGHSQGGVSVNEETARDDTYNTKLVKPDLLANTTMNMGGLASDFEGSPFENWSMILFPYATGDFHSGTSEFRYTDKDGKEKILYHNGYTNYTAAMKQIMEKAGIENADMVLVTGYSAGGWGTAILADDIFTNYFPNAVNKNLFVDSSMALYDDWHDTAVNVCQSPKSITDNIKTDNLTMDMLRHLREKYGDGIHLLYGTSTRDGDLAKVQNYFQNGIMDVDESVADKYQQTLKEAVPQFKELNVSLFIWEGLGYYDDPRNITSHTIIATPVVWVTFEEQNKSVAEWLTDAIDGKLNDYGVDLVDKVYEKTENK